MAKDNVVQAFKTIYDLKLHETLIFRAYLEITRVPGGWIYEFYNTCTEEFTPVFVPFNDEFQNKSEKI